MQVEKAVWIALAQHARRKLFDVSLSEERKSERSSKTTEQAILGVVCAGCQFSLSFRRSVERHSTGDLACFIRDHDYNFQRI